MLIPTTNAVVFITASGAVLSNSSRSFTVQGLTFNGNALANITCYSEASAFFTVLEDITIVNVVYAGIFQRGHGITLNNIKQYGSGQWLFTGVGTGVGDNVFDVNITNVTHESSGGASWASAPSWFYFYRAVNVNMANVVTGSLDGAAVGILLQGDVEGFFATNTIIVYPTVGIESIIGADGIYPAYVYLNNFAVDQPTNTGIDLAGAVNRLTNVNVTFGDARTNTGPGIVMRAASSDSYLSGVRISHMYNSGLVIEAGAQVKANGLELTTNHVSGTGFDLDIGASTAANVNFYGKNNLGTVNATGQRIVNGMTSKQVSRSTTPASTGANTTPTTLQSYSIPASTLKPGQTVKLEAYGTFAANANNKTIELVFGSQQVSVHIGTFNNIAWFARGEILVTGASTQSWNGNVFVNGQALTSTQGTSSVTDTSAILVQLRATNGTASAGDITCNGFTADILD
jgi:hypothetical protein